MFTTIDIEQIMQQLSKFTAQIKSVRNRIGNIEKEKVVKFVNDVKNWKLHCFLPYWPNFKSVEYWYQNFFQLISFKNWKFYLPSISNGRKTFGWKEQ